MSYESETSFLLSGIRHKLPNFEPMKDELDMYFLPPIKIDNFTKNDGADYLLHIKKGEFNLCEGENLNVALSCSGFDKDTYKKKILENAADHPTCKQKIVEAKNEAKKECEQKKLENSVGVDGTIVAKIKLVSKKVNDDIDFLKATKIEKGKKILMEFTSDIEIKDPKFQYGIIDPLEPYMDCKLNEDKKSFTCEFTPTSDTIPEEGQELKDITEFVIKATTESNGNEIEADNKTLLGNLMSNDQNTENTQEDTEGARGSEIPKPSPTPSPSPAPSPAPGSEGFGNMFPLEGICVGEKKQICLFLFLILVSFVVLNIDDILKKVRKFMKKLVC